MLAGDMESPEADKRFTSLFERHYPDVHAYCTRRIGYSEADDVAADVFATAWRRIDDIDWETADHGCSVSLGGCSATVGAL